MKIEVVRLGYVGLPLWIQFARSCVSVLGLDADPKKVELLNNGQSYIKHIQSAEIAKLVAADRPVGPLLFTSKGDRPEGRGDSGATVSFNPPWWEEQKQQKCLSGTS